MKKILAAAAIVAGMATSAFAQENDRYTMISIKDEGASDYDAQYYFSGRANCAGHSPTLDPDFYKSALQAFVDRGVFDKNVLNRQGELDNSDVPDIRFSIIAREGLPWPIEVKRSCIQKTLAERIKRQIGYTQ